MHMGIVSLYVDVNHHKKVSSAFESTSMLQDSEKHKADKSQKLNIRQNFMDAFCPHYDQLQSTFFLLTSLI